jgi:Na+/H+-dicarboxylate symporter
VFGAVAAVITAQGLGVLVVYAKLLGSVYRRWRCCGWR